MRSLLPPGSSRQFKAFPPPHQDQSLRHGQGRRVDATQCRAPDIERTDPIKNDVAMIGDLVPPSRQLLR